VKQYADELSSKHVVGDVSLDTIFWETPATFTKYGTYANILHGRFVNYYQSATELTYLLHEYPKDIFDIARDVKCKNTGVIHMRFARNGDIDPVAFSVINSELNMTVFYSYADLWDRIPIEMCMWSMLQDLLCHVNSGIIPGRLTLYIHQPSVTLSKYDAVLQYIKTVQDNVREIEAMRTVSKNRIDKEDKNINGLKAYIENNGHVFEDKVGSYILNIKPTAFSVDSYRYIDGVGQTGVIREEFEP
jgi:hypothetical protein